MRSVIIIIAIFLVSCTEKENQSNSTRISTTACAKQIQDGSVVDCEVSSDAEKRLSKMMVESNRIDKQYPGPKILDLEHLFRVQSISDEGTIVLENGVRLGLAGLDCHHSDLIRYLETMFLGYNPAMLSYQETGYINNSIKYAYVWEVNTNFGKDSKDSEIIIGPSISSTNETAITSAWCHPKQQEKHIYHERYLQLSKLVK